MDVVFEALATDIEAAKGTISPEQAGRISAALSELKPDLGMTVDDLRSTEAILHFTDAILPGWSIHLRGKATEPDGHWTCTLRRSSSRDDDEFIGIGHGPVPATAILCAVLRMMAYKHV